MPMIHVDPQNNHLESARFPVTYPTQRQTASRAVIAVLEGLLPYLEPAPAKILLGAIDVLRRLLSQGHLQAPGAQGEDRDGEGEREGEVIHLEPPAQYAQDSSEFLPRVLRMRREAAGLSRHELAARAGVSESTIRNLETGRTPLTRSTLSRLHSVAELRLEQAIHSGPVLPREADAFAPNCWLAPGFDPIKMITDLAMQLNGRGGHIEQTHLYLDHMSAACWCALADQENYAAAELAVPVDKAARTILRCIGGAGLDVIGLGPGDGKSEVNLVRQLLGGGDQGDLRLYLLDISQPLLSIAYKHAADTLAERRGVAIFAIQGNFHHLPRYTQLLYLPQRAHRRRMVCMFGYTFGNLNNEILFLRNSLVGFAPGDLLLLNVGLVCAPADRPNEVREKDPRLSGKLPENLQRRFEEWLAGPVRRYARGVTNIEFSTELDTTSCPIPRSYATEIRATVRGARGEDERQFSMVYVKRYEQSALLECLRQEGWDPVEGWVYGDGGTRLLYLFRKRG